MLERTSTETPCQVSPFKFGIPGMLGGNHLIEKGVECVSNVHQKKALLKITSPLGSQTHSDSFLEKPVHIRDDGLFITNPFPKWAGPPPPTARAGYHSQVSIWAREEQFQSHTLSTHRILRPFLIVSIGLKQASTIVVFQFTLLWERSGADYKGPHWYKREKLTKHFRHWWGPKGLCSATFKWDHRWQRGANSNDYSFAFFVFF